MDKGALAHLSIQLSGSHRSSLKPTGHILAVLMFPGGGFTLELRGAPLGAVSTRSNLKAGM